MTSRALEADKAERSVCCHDEAAEPDLLYECSRCGCEFPASDLDGPPFRCPVDRIFLARAGSEQCTECGGEWEGTEWADVWRCPDCGGTFDADGAEHVCTPAEHEAEDERKRASMDESMRRYRAGNYAKQPDVLHTAAALRALGFSVKVEDLVGEPPEYEPQRRPDLGGLNWDDDFDFTMSPSGGQLIRTDGLPFRRLVGLVAGHVGVE